ncbi:hypothetical protein T492DRAFT_883555 [Pavlovales sp. CCMP2436]|nr:hypothetical protein T492DRAFT_883555 [Pavlovales sp. CCMP2436]
MRCNYQPVLHCRNVRQSARIVRMDREVLRTGTKASLDFEFLFRPEFIAVGSRLIFREGKTKGIGNITFLHPPDEPAAVPGRREAAAAAQRAAVAAAAASTAAAAPDAYAKALAARKAGRAAKQQAAVCTQHGARLFVPCWPRTSAWARCADA